MSMTESNKILLGKIDKKCVENYRNATENVICVESTFISDEN